MTGATAGMPGVRFRLTAGPDSAPAREVESIRVSSESIDPTVQKAAIINLPTANMLGK
jgi:hypothetical protein